MERGKKEEEDGVGGLFLPLPSEATFGFLADLFHVAACPQAIEEEEGGPPFFLSPLQRALEAEEEEHILYYDT